jgi:hypothetical protein
MLRPILTLALNITLTLPLTLTLTLTLTYRDPLLEPLGAVVAQLARPG